MDDRQFNGGDIHNETSRHGGQQTSVHGTSSSQAWAIRGQKDGLCLINCIPWSLIKKLSVAKIPLAGDCRAGGRFFHEIVRQAEFGKYQ
jgi:hypothetical protein